MILAKRHAFNLTQENCSEIIMHVFKGRLSKQIVQTLSPRPPWSPKTSLQLYYIQGILSKV